VNVPALPEHGDPRDEVSAVAAPFLFDSTDGSFCFDVYATIASAVPHVRPAPPPASTVL